MSDLSNKLKLVYEISADFIVIILINIESQNQLSWYENKNLQVINTTLLLLLSLSSYISYLSTNHQ